jgi:hypothetical protein
MNRVLALGPRARRLRRYGAILSASVLVALLLAPAAQAVHDLAFELDGNVAVDTSDFDWASFFNSAGAESPVLPDASRPGFTDSGFSHDFSRKTNGSYSTVDASTYATGSKDTLPITPGWQCSKSNNVNDKIDILNAYAVAYVDPATNDQILYFALERFSNDGDANVAFWFLQSNVNCVSPGGGSTPFSGHHVDGDLLVVSSFTKGGVVSTIDVYKWVGDDTGSLNQTAIAHGVDCKQTTGPDDTCATVNDPNNGVVDPPWDTQNKNGTSDLQVSEFFEGGLNLTNSGIGDHCFNTFIADTRSSQSLTATLFDFARGSLGECDVSLTSTPSVTTTSLGSSVAITDTANVSGTTAGGGAGPTPTGTVSFFLCGPGASNCTTGGSPIPSDPPAAVTLGACSPPAAGHACATSANVRSMISTPGTYCFRAVYDPGADPNYSGKSAEDGSSGECFTVTDTSSGSTAQTWLPNDSATFSSDGGSNLAGSVQFTLYASGNCTGTILYQETANAPGGTSSFTVNTTNGDGNGTGLAADKSFDVSDSPLTVSWQAVFTSTNSTGGSTAPCESSTVTIDDDITAP